MTSQFSSSSNPFRRKSANAETPVVNQENALHISPDGQEATSIDLSRTKIVKKVRVQSPRPSPPGSDLNPRTLTSTSTPEPPGKGGDYRQIHPFESPEREEPDDSPSLKFKSLSLKGISNAPPNPFAKTLENLEPADVQPVHSSGRASLDVDAFKRLLMTGHSGRTATSGAPVHSFQHSLMSDGTSTDTSSISRQSIFSIHEAHTESPRTSHEFSEQESERYSVVQDFSTARKKPPPPSSRHGKLIRVELRDDAGQTKEASRPSSSSSKVSQQLSYRSSSPLTRSQTDLNKPLPAAPSRPSNDFNKEDRESIFDREAAGKIPEPPSPPSSLNRKIPPAPPITRRHSHMISSSRNPSEGRISPRVQEQTPSPGLPDFRRERSSSNSSTAPAPPPSRRPAPGRGISNLSMSSPFTTPIESLLTSPKTAPPPPPPPTRSKSTRKLPRPASIIGMETQKEPPRRPAAPPPPPSRRKSSSSNSMDYSVESRGDTFGKSVNNSRHASDALDHRETGEPEDMFAPKGPDILAELAALQREVEAAAQQGNVG